MFSLSFNKLCLCRFHFFLMLWCSSSLVDWWEYSSIYCWTSVGGASLKVWLLWEELHWRCDCCGRSFTEGVIVVGGASLKVWLLWEELHWRCDCCGRSFTEGVIVVGGASLKVWLLWEELHWRCDCCGRSFTEGVIVVGGASLKEEQICQNKRWISYWVCFCTNSHILMIYVYLFIYLSIKVN